MLGARSAALWERARNRTVVGSQQRRPAAPQTTLSTLIRIKRCFASSKLMEPFIGQYASQRYLTVFFVLFFFPHRSEICQSVTLQMAYSVFSMATIAMVCGRTIARSEESLKNRQYLWFVGFSSVLPCVRHTQLFPRCLCNLLFCK